MLCSRAMWLYCLPLSQGDSRCLQPLSISRHAKPFTRLAGPVLALVAFLVASAVLGPPAEAQPPCHVPGDYATLQEALDESDVPRHQCRSRDLLRKHHDRP